MPNNGKYLEQIVQLLEKSLSPEDLVEHDIQLPNLLSPSGYTTQCDIVITKGKKPRQTLTIIEVQDRKSKVMSNDFRGWEQKLNEVGAQHLIVVSRQKFSKSIKEKASLSGNRIFLMNIKKEMPEDIPNFINLKFTDIQNNLKIHSLIPHVSINKAQLLGINIEDLNKKITVNTKEKTWSFDKFSLVSLNDICHTFNNRTQIKYELYKEEFSLKIADKFLPIGLEFEYEWIQNKTEYPISFLSYEQIGEGTLAWIAEINYQNNNGKSILKIPIIKNEDYYSINLSKMDIDSASIEQLDIYHSS